MSVPPRPRLADHALARRHVVDGREHVVLFDQRTGGVVVLEPGVWDVLAAADGTRDLEGIRLAARRSGTPTRVDDIARLLDELDELGLVAGPTERQGPGRVRIVTDETPRDRPVEPLPGYGLQCDRSGACCRNYATVLMTQAEVARARTLLPTHRVGSIEGPRLFLPVAGSEPGELWCTTHRDGACGYLEPDGGCALHRVGGLAGKPLGCALFPVTFVDDGTTVRASVKTECACVLDSACAPSDEPLVDPTWRTAADLPPAVAVARVPDRVVLSGDVTLTRGELRALTDAWLEAPSAADPAHAAWAMGTAMAERGADAGLRAWSRPDAPVLDDVGRWVEALHARAARRARDNERWRSRADAVRRGVEAIAAAALVCRDRDALAEVIAATPADPGVEAFYLRAAAFGHALVDRPLAVSLRDRAIRMWIARAMQWIADARGEAIRSPLATVDAMLRAYGIGNYVRTRYQE